MSGTAEIKGGQVVDSATLASARRELAQSWVLVLAGGLGTRLRSVVADRPKVLALVGGQPFLDILVAQLYGHGVRRIGLLLGHLHQQVQDHVERVLQLRFPDIEFALSVEPEPLGTAGALRHAGALVQDAAGTAILMNGDTFVAFDPAAVLAVHCASGAAVTMAVQHVDDISRFGAVELDAHGRVIAFREKQADTGPGWINAGVYAFEPALLDLIAQAESRGNYNAYFGNASNTEVKFTEMSVAEVLDWQKAFVAQGNPSSAVGRYQIISTTLAGLVQELDLQGSEMFDEAMQDRLALALLERRGVVAYINGRIDAKQFAAELAKEWAGLPRILGDAPEKSYYAGDGLNTALVGADEVLRVVGVIAAR